MAKRPDIKGEDVPIVKLVPLHERKVNARSYNRLMSSIKSIGLIEPLCVYKENGSYVILDGFLRYKVCLNLGIETLPCMILPNKDAYTPNRMVNHITPIQESKMITQSLDTLSEERIVQTLGLTTLRNHIDRETFIHLHQQVIDAYEDRTIRKVTATEMAYVKPERQVAILEEMRRVSDFSASFARTLILRTPPNLRNKKLKRRSPWEQGAKQKKELAVKLEEAEQRYDFYSMLYRQYVTDLLKLCIYVRKLISNEKVSSYLKEHHAEIFATFQRIVFETERGGKKGSSGSSE